MNRQRKEYCIDDDGRIQTMHGDLDLVPRTNPEASPERRREDIQAADLYRQLVPTLDSTGPVTFTDGHRCTCAAPNGPSNTGVKLRGSEVCRASSASTPCCAAPSFLSTAVRPLK